MSRRGIDISEWNGVLDWAKVKAAGISFAILRAGYGRYQVDGCFYENIQGALAQGIPVGVYWFSYALKESYARHEAKKCLETIAGYDLKLPVFYDFEYDTIRYAAEQGVTLGKTEFNQFAAAFLEEIQAAGYTPGIYYNLDYYRTMVDPAVLGGYKLWYAQYASSISVTAPPDIAIWQYTSSGGISGISGTFDLNELLDDSLLAGTDYTGPTGWQKDDVGWWYVHDDGTYTTSAWEKIDGVWYFFDAEGYMLENKWVVTNYNAYYLGPDGGMVSDRALKIDGQGRLVPDGGWYETLGQVPAVYRETADKLVALDILRGTGGSGEDRVIDLSENEMRLLVMLDRAGCFGA